MKELFVTYPIALKLKELGFDEPCFGYYLCKNSASGISDLEITTEWIDLLPYDSSSCKAPLWQQVEEWFRNNYKIQIVYNSTPSFDRIYPSKFQSAIHILFNPFRWTTGKYYIGETHEEAREQAILKCIELCQKENQFNTNKP